MKNKLPEWLKLSIFFFSSMDSPSVHVRNYVPSSISRNFKPLNSSQEKLIILADSNRSVYIKISISKVLEEFNVEVIELVKNRIRVTSLEEKVPEEFNPDLNMLAGFFNQMFKCRTSKDTHQFFYWIAKEFDYLRKLFISEEFLKKLDKEVRSEIIMKFILSRKDLNEDLLIYPKRLSDLKLYFELVDDSELLKWMYLTPERFIFYGNTSLELDSPEISRRLAKVINQVYYLGRATNANNYILDPLIKIIMVTIPEEIQKEILAEALLKQIKKSVIKSI